MNNYVFDVDGTLTPSRGLMNEQFKEFFLDFQSRNNVYLVTGSDRDKTIEQVGEDVYNASQIVFNCSGNSIWKQDKSIFTADWKLADAPWKFLESKLLYSRFAPKTGWHFDERPGMLNFSIVGRKATPEQRQQYVEWDQSTNEREIIATELNDHFGEKYNVHATIGGETGIDISGNGLDKSQILSYFVGSSVIFFGDKMNEGGNDYPLYEAIKRRRLLGDSCHNVSDWQETWDILRQY